MKVLIISYSPMSLSNNGGKSFLSLFSSFSKEELIQFYINPNIPLVDSCNSFYIQKEAMLLRPRKNRKMVFHIANNEKVDKSKENDLKIYAKSHKSRHIKLLLRDAIWGLSTWDNKCLHDWIMHEKPDIVFSDTGDSSFIYKVSIKISKKYNLPLIGYFGDDYYSLRGNFFQVFKNVQLAKLRNTIRSFSKKCDRLIFVNEYFAEYYLKEFNLEKTKVLTIYNGSNFSFANNNYIINNINRIIIRYIGNLSLGRGENLCKIGRAIDIINNKKKSNHIIEVYAKNRDDFTEKIENIKSIVYKGFVPGEKVNDIILSSDILIHTESFSPNYIKKAKYSMSTKIADSLSSGKCLLAFGPSDVASIEYLTKNDCAFVITDEKLLVSKLEVLLSNIDMIKTIGKNGVCIANMNHNSRKNSIFLYNELKNI